MCRMSGVRCHVSQVRCFLFGTKGWSKLLEGLLSLGPAPSSFHGIGPLGRFGLVVAMSVCVFVCPLPMRFFSVDRVRSFACTESALAWSPKNVFGWEGEGGGLLNAEGKHKPEQLD